MDPNEMLKQLRAELHKFYTETDEDYRRWAAEEIAYLFEDLDEWLSRGGFPPDEWEEQK